MSHPTDTTPHPVYALSHELVERVCSLSPISATLAGVRGFDHRWDDLGPEGQARLGACYREFSARLASLPAGRGRYEALAVRVLREHLDERIEYHDSGDPFFDLNNISSSFQLIPMVFDFMENSTRPGLEAIAERLEGLGAVCEGYRALLAEGLRSGRVVARRQVLAAVQQGRAQAGEASLYRALAARCRQQPAAGPALADRIERGAEAAHAAVGAFTAWLDRVYLPQAASEDGVGRERYARCARRHLGDTIDLEEAYAWGWGEIRRIEAEAQALASEIRPGASVREVIAWLASDPAHAVPLPEPFLEMMLERQQRAMGQLDGRHFDVPEPLRRIDVKLAPPGGKPGAYYCAPSEDFSRPGSVWYSPGSRSSMPLWQEITTAYHEGFPGHHLQCSVQLWLADRLSRFHRLFAAWTGYSEGWALYAEQLMLELGFFERPEFALGMHCAQLARACRVVVDIGLHLGLTIPRDAGFHPGERWRFELAAEMMHERAFLDAELAHSEAVRYLGWPAQAISYKLGQRAILDLRDERRRREGAAFDLRRFNDDVLAVGSVGLATLREMVLG